MTDPRVRKLAQVLVHYSLELQPGEEFLLLTSPLANELNLAVYEEALGAGALVVVEALLPGMEEVFYRCASDAQLEYISPLHRLVIEKFKAKLTIEADENPRALSSVDPSRLALRRRSRRDLFSHQLKRMATRDFKWCGAVFPTQALAQEADMSLREYEDFVYTAGMLNLADPEAAWREEAARQQHWMDWLSGHERIALHGEDIDLSLSIKGRTFLGAAGRDNFPDGEIYTSPVEDSVNGWVRFAYPAVFDGSEVIDVELWFEDGKVVKERAAKGQELLTGLLNTDRGARYLGELGIGTNYQIPRFSKNMLFDEKLGGTIHLAVGLGFPEVGGKNESGLHWDLLCNMMHSEMSADGEVFYQDGKFVV